MKQLSLTLSVVTLLLMLLGTEAEAALGRKPVFSLLESRHKYVVMQEWDLSCGAAALTTLLRYQHGLDVTEKEVASQLINRKEYIDNPELLRIKQGFSLLDLKRYTDGLGYTGNGYGNLNLDNLITMAPILVPVRLDGYNHFVVFRGIAGRRVLLADPAWGNRVLDKQAFLDAWMDLGDLGQVGFTVTSESSPPELNLLGPQAMDFVMIR